MPLEAKLLGQNIPYPTQYAPYILLPVPRALNRQAQDIPDGIFTGVDTWHAFEASFLTDSGLPVTGLLKITYPASSPNISESKSLKLSLNTLNMTPLGPNISSASRTYADTVASDLQQAIGSPVQLTFHPTSTPEAIAPFDFPDYTLLETLPEALSARYTHYTETISLLTRQPLPGGTARLATHLLRSNCKITHQPDWGSLYLHIQADTLPHPADLLAYIVSLRSENHFHEEICETIYTRVHEAFHPTYLAVTCLYTRRGGINICPSRASHANLLPPNLHDTHRLTAKLLRE